MPRRTRRIGAGQNLFGATGWLFADLFIALAVGFLVANTVGYVPPPTARAQPTPTPVPPRALDLKPITVTLHVDYNGLLRDDPSAIASAEQQVRQAAGLSNRSAGLVLAFGGALGVGPGEALQIAAKVDSDVLTDLGRQGFVFQTTVYREFFSLDADPSTVSIDVYVFKQ
jgi:hypothetical protein